jgi:hypothetical protein
VRLTLSVVNRMVTLSLGPLIFFQRIASVRSSHITPC